jgi:N6-adenosine-specific RNA methylase IME4
VGEASDAALSALGILFLRSDMEIDIDLIQHTEHKREPGNVESLKKSIQECGLINPITINQNNVLLAGRRRFQALKELGWSKIPVRIVNSKNDLFDFRVAIIENIERKNLSDPEYAAAIKEYDELKRELEGEKDKTSFLKKGSRMPQCSERDNDGWTQDKTADDLNMSRQAVGKAINIAKAVEGYPELASKKGSVILREAKKKKDTEAIEKKEFPIVEGKFKTLLIDPPWDYDQLSIAGRGHPEYHTLSIDELMSFNLQQYSEPNSHLYIWSTNNFLYQALKLGEHWGWNYKTVITWIKPSIGLGSYFRNSTEQLLFFVRGALSTRQNDIPTHFEANRGEHSEKPEISYQIIERTSYPAYLEIFSRKQRKDWTTWGNIA